MAWIPSTDSARCLFSSRERRLRAMTTSAPFSRSSLDHLDGDGFHVPVEMHSRPRARLGEEIGRGDAEDAHFRLRRLQDHVSGNPFRQILVVKIQV